MRSNKLFFKYSTGPVGFLSNFSPHKVIYNGKEYKTSEHLYQALKSTNELDHEKVRLSATPKESKQTAQTISIRDDWDKYRLEAMRITLRAKLESNPELIQKLLETHPDELLEESRFDKFWGTTTNLDGENWLGKIWMEIRDYFYSRVEIKD